MFLLLTFPRDQPWDVTPHLGEGGWFFIFDYSSPFCFLLIEIYYTFSISYLVLTCYVYYYCIWWVLTRSSPVSSQDFYCSLPRDSHRMWLLAWEFLLIKSVLHFAFLHLLSGYYYYDYVVIGVLRPSWLTEIHCWIVEILSKVVKF